jgi:eukaryotic-like serine/threonine-protein kinase
MDTISKIGRYRIDGWLASGAMGDVYRGFDPVINRPVAIKILRRELARGGDAEIWLQRFRREARAAGHRSHPNIVTILDFGEEDGAPFLAMEYIDGKGLDQLLKEIGRFPHGRGVPVVLQILDAVGFAHTHGVIHRDIKPSNILVTDGGQVKVADFGIAHVDASELTITGDVLGTPSYMSPEQLWGAPVDHRADLFAAGVVLYEVLTGVKPFRANSVPEMMSLMQTRGPEDLLVHAPDAPPALKDVIARALAFDPERRFPTASEFSHALIEARSAASAPQLVAIPRDETVVGAAPAPPPPPAPVLPLEVSTLSGDLLAEIERDLARIIGPVARIAVQRALKSSSGLEQLHLRLANHIDDEDARAGFLRRGKGRVDALAASGAPPPPTSPHLVDASEKLPAVLPPDILSRIEANLTRFIGPIARVLVRQQLSKSTSVIDLYTELANHIPDMRDRAAFLKSRPFA